MTEPRMYDDQEWAQRLAAAVEATLARRAARKAFQDDHRARRDAGLARRHAQKLRRADERLQQAQRDGIEDSWFEEET